MEKAIVIDGYSFTDKNMAEQARKEAEGIRYVRSRTDMSKPQQVFSVYHRLLDQKMFQTQVGYAYLKELQDYLKAVPGIHSEDIKPIPVVANLVVEDTAGVSSLWRNRLRREQQIRRRSVIANVVLALVIAGMFLITATSGQTTILNYEKKLQDRYAQWEQELTEREEAVREKEQILELEFDTGVDDME